MAALQADADYDPSFGVPFSAFVRQRVLAGAFTEYRREWKYAVRFISGCTRNELRFARKDSGCSPDLLISLQRVLSRLPEFDRWIIKELFWRGNTEAAVARKLGLSQQAVSKRKKLILHDLRSALSTPNNNGQKNRGSSK